METSGDFSLEIVVNLLKYKSLAIPVERQRAIDTAPTIKGHCRAFGVKQEPEGELLLFDSRLDRKHRILKWSTDDNLETMESNTIWHTDRTFKAFTALFYPQFKIHAVVNDQTDPLVFSFSKRK